MKLANLRDLYMMELRDLYSAESQIVKALPKMIKAASSPKLQQAFQEHLDQTKSQIQRLDDIFNQMGSSPRGKKCEGMEGILAEGEDVLNQEADPDVKDAALIAAAQKVEHYEMAGYGTVRTFARLFGDQQMVDLLENTLSEEKRTDKLLTKIAEQGINKEAAR